MIINIGAIPYTLTPLTVAQGDEEGMLGQTHYDKHIIYVGEWLPPPHQAVILLHELIHATFYQSGQKGEKLPEEKICETLDKGLSGVFKQNPWVLDKYRRALLDNVSIFAPEPGLGGQLEPGGIVYLPDGKLPPTGFLDHSLQLQRQHFQGVAH